MDADGPIRSHFARQANRQPAEKWAASRYDGASWVPSSIVLKVLNLFFVPYLGVLDCGVSWRFGGMSRLVLYRVPRCSIMANLVRES